MTLDRLSITDFLTDGSLAALCEAATSITRRAVRLRDAHGREVVSYDPDDGAPAPGARRWHVRDDAGVSNGPSRLAAQAGLASSIRVTPTFVAPLTVQGQTIGTLSVDPPAPGAECPIGEADVQRFVSLIASIASEVCERAQQEADRADELRALLKLSSMLVAAGDPDETLAAAVHAAVELLGADAGTIRILDDESEHLLLRAYTGLSDEYIARAATLPASRVLDTEELRGGVVAITDLDADPRVLRRDELKREGLRSMISAGLSFKGRTLGTLRLYTRARREFTDIERSLLRSIAQHSAAAVASARLLETELDHRRMLRQVHLAAEVQGRMFPRVAPAMPGVEIAARHIPSLELSGDFYDFIDLRDIRPTPHAAGTPAPPRLGLLIGDVVGKGVAAALHMSSVRASLRAHVQDLPDLDEVMNRVNAAMCRDTLESEFATVFYGILDANALRLTYSNAGHDHPIIVRVPEHRPPTMADVDELATGGMVIGVDPSQRYQSASFDLRPGDVLLLYTDGLSDAMSFDKERFGKKRIRVAMLQALREKPDASADEIADHIVWENRRFVGLNERSDDTTLIVLRVPFASRDDAGPE